MKEGMKEAIMCHWKCGKDAACHAKCPKPFAPIVKACRDYPKIKACHDACKDDDCNQKCPKFDEEWMNEKIAAHPERAKKFAEKKCPMIEKAHACHEACKPGDFKCHHSYPQTDMTTPNTWLSHDHQKASCWSLMTIPSSVS
jgi:hypothetical protein